MEPETSATANSDAAKTLVTEEIISSPEMQERGEGCCSKSSANCCDIKIKSCCGKVKNDSLKNQRSLFSSWLQRPHKCVEICQQGCCVTLMCDGNRKKLCLSIICSKSDVKCCDTSSCCIGKCVPEGCCRKSNTSKDVSPSSTNCCGASSKDGDDNTEWNAYAPGCSKQDSANNAEDPIDTTEADKDKNDKCCSFDGHCEEKCQSYVCCKTLKNKLDDESHKQEMNHEETCCRCKTRQCECKTETNNDERNLCKNDDCCGTCKHEGTCCCNVSTKCCAICKSKCCANSSAEDKPDGFAKRRCKNVEKSCCQREKATGGCCDSKTTSVDVRFGCNIGTTNVEPRCCCDIRKNDECCGEFKDGNTITGRCCCNISTTCCGNCTTCCVNSSVEDRPEGSAKFNRKNDEESCCQSEKATGGCCNSKPTSVNVQCDCKTGMENDEADSCCNMRKNDDCCEKYKTVITMTGRCCSNSSTKCCGGCKSTCCVNISAEDRPEGSAKCRCKNVEESCCHSKKATGGCCDLTATPEIKSGGYMKKRCTAIVGDGYGHWKLNCFCKNKIRCEILACDCNCVSWKNMRCFLSHDGLPNCVHGAKCYCVRKRGCCNMSNSVGEECSYKPRSHCHRGLTMSRCDTCTCCGPKRLPRTTCCSGSSSFECRMRLKDLHL